MWSRLLEHGRQNPAMGQSDRDVGEVVVAAADELAPGTTKKFMLPTVDAPVEAFLVNFEGELHAWVNRCRHVPLTMDWVENRFLDDLVRD